MGPIDALSERVWLEALRQGVRTAPRVVWLSDGARGLWRIFSERFATLPNVVAILDFYHAASHLAQVASAMAVGGPARAAKVWFQNARHILRHQHPDDILDHLTNEIKRASKKPFTFLVLHQVQRYLEAHKDHLDYERLKQLGLPIGSGLVESACKWLIQQHFKGVGMRWDQDGFHHLLHLRLAWVNNRFDALFLAQTSLSPIS